MSVLEPLHAVRGQYLCIMHHNFLESLGVEKNQGCRSWADPFHHHYLPHQLPQQTPAAFHQSLCHFYSETELDGLSQTQRLKKGYHRRDVRNRFAQPVSKLNFPSWSQDLSGKTSTMPRTLIYFKTRKVPSLLTSFRGLLEGSQLTVTELHDALLLCVFYFSLIGSHHFCFNWLFSYALKKVAESV